MKTGYSVVSISLFLLISFSIALPNTFMNGTEILEGSWNGKQVEYLDREILVGLKPGMSQADIVAQIGDLDVEIVRDADRFGFLKLKAGNRGGFMALIQAIAELPSVRYAEPNMVDHAFIIPNDPRFDEQWHYHNTGQVPPGGSPDADIDAPEGWDVSTGGAVIKVGVLDSGIPIQNGELSHPDLDDPTRYLFGWDFSNSDAEPKDDNGHGTHVSGTIAAKTDNLIGVAGVSWNAQILAIKVFDGNGSGSHENFRDGCIYAVDNGCKVINYSGGGSDSDTKEHGVAYADTHGVVVCASAGNNWHGSCSYPGAYAAQYTNLICVSATDHHDQSSAYSSIGPEVTVSAPGGYGSPYDENDVISTMPNYTVYLNTAYGIPLNYGPLAGTSMASPHVAGFAALILSMNPSLEPDSVRQIMINTSDDLGSAGWDSYFGWGRINVFNAMSQLGSVTIVHEPLTDTKDTINDYEIDCSIYSYAELVADSLLLRYQIESTWYEEILEARVAPNQYHAFIPAQSPGTVIDYYIFVQNSEGDADSTDTYSFRVIDYAVVLAPDSLTGTGAVDDSLWYELWIKNDGVLDDYFDLSVSGNNWATSFWDASGSSMIAQTPIVVPDDSIQVLVRVIIPYSLYGDKDIATATVASGGDPVISKSVILTTVSEGQPWDIPFSDDFPSTHIEIGRWVYNAGAEINGFGMNEPSPMFSLNIDGDPSGGDTIQSQAIDLEGLNNIVVRYEYQRTGGGDSPEWGDDLTLEYMNSSLEWTHLQTHLGDGDDMTVFETSEIQLPSDAYHRGFKLRFSTECTTGDYDDWFVDDVYVGLPSDYDLYVTPGYTNRFGASGDSAWFRIVVHNKGLLADTYLLSDSASTWDVSFWDEEGAVQLTNTGIIQPAESLTVITKVEIPIGTPVAESEVTWIKAESSADPSVTAYSVLVSRSAGPAAAFPWYEPFADPLLDDSNWIFDVGTSVVSTDAAPSPPYVLNLDGGKDTVTSRPINLSGQSGALLAYMYQRGGDGATPGEGDDLTFEYMAKFGEWYTISTQPGAGDDMSDFEQVFESLPENALHSSFQIRVISGGDGEGVDDWFVDDIRVDFTPSIDVSPAYLSFSSPAGIQSQESIEVTNAGPGSLSYNVSVVPVIDPDGVFGSLLSAGMVEPAWRDVALGIQDFEEPKGSDASMAGYDVIYNAGGPDDFGNLWIDSDEPGGPQFAWIDIQSTGTEVSGLDDDNFVGPFPIGFDFPFYGETYSEFYISSNGFIGFGPTYEYDEHSNQPLMDSKSPNNIIAWCWDDIDPTNENNPPGQVYYSSENGRLIVQFVEYAEFSGEAGDIINAEVIIRSNGEIKFQYMSIAPGFDILSATIGIENATGDDGLMVVYNGAYLHDALAVGFYAPATWLSVDPFMGTVPPGGADTVTVTADATDLAMGQHLSQLEIRSNDPDSSDMFWQIPVDLTITSSFLCGDCNESGEVDIDDAVYVISYIFAGGPAPVPYEAGDVNCTGEVDIDDVVYLITYIFSGGPAPCANCP